MCPLGKDNMAVPCRFQLYVYHLLTAWLWPNSWMFYVIAWVIKIIKRKTVFTLLFSGSADLPGFTWGTLLTYPSQVENVLNTPHLPIEFSPSLLLTRVLALLNQYKLVRGWRSNSGKGLLGPLLQQEGSRTNNRFPCWLASWEGGKLLSNMGWFWWCVQGLGQ